MRPRVLLVLLAVLASFVAPAAVAEPPPLTTGAYRTGYVPLPDGGELRYTVFLPNDTGRFPTLMQYDGYAAGTNPYENGQDAFGARMLAKGYAILGVNVRGSGCSSGTFDVFSGQWARDGYDAVEWAAAQPWSDGRIGMFGVSMPAIMSLYVAALRPPHLTAIAPGAALADLYRDVAYPGGIFNAAFPTAWTALQKGTGYQDTALVVAADGGDTRCLGYTAGHQPPDQVVAVQAAQHPYDDAFWSRSLRDRMADIDVPVLSMTSWQDEQVSSRVVLPYHLLRNDISWHVVSNGSHGVSVDAPAFADLQDAFFSHFLGGVANGFETTPHVQVWHELPDATMTPSWVTSYGSWPSPAPLSLLLRPDGTLAAGGPAPSGSVSYAYPAPAPLVPTVGSGAPDAEYAAYSTPGYGAAFTTAPLAADLEAFGTASVDLWVSSTATDTDLQVTLSEVRPDGQEEYVQRGWLRASLRALDASRSDVLRPEHPFTASSVAPLTPGVATKMRVEVLPFGHVFRAGSRLRLTVEAPVSLTGFRGFAVVPTPAVNTVWTGVGHESRLVLGAVPALGVPAAYPACGSLVNQPCRAAS